MATVALRPDAVQPSGGQEFLAERFAVFGKITRKTYVLDRGVYNSYREEVKAPPLSTRRQWTITGRLRPMRFSTHVGYRRE
jgi:hypothetical protein